MSPTAQPLSLASLLAAVRAGWLDFRARPVASMAYAAVFVVVGGGLVSLLVSVGLAPLALALSIAFLLFGPVALAGFFALARLPMGTPLGSSLAAAILAMRRADRSVWAIGAFCVFMALVWLTDAGTLYSFMIGERFHDWSMVVPRWFHRRFHGGALVMGAGLALVVYVVSVHGVPLMLRWRLGLVAAIVASARAVGRSLLIHMLWALILGFALISSIFVFPALLLVLPVAAYASDHITRQVFGAPRERGPQETV